MAGGSGVEWYFGYKFPHNDLNCEDWRSRDHLWDLTRYAVEFFHEYLPFTEMKHADEFTTAEDDFCFAKAGVVTLSICLTAVRRNWIWAGLPTRSR